MHAANDRPASQGLRPGHPSQDNRTLNGNDRRSPQERAEPRHLSCSVVAYNGETLGFSRSFPRDVFEQIRENFNAKNDIRIIEDTLKWYAISHNS
jgi:hypothetical protein